MIIVYRHGKVALPALASGVLVLRAEGRGVQGYISALALYPETPTDSVTWKILINGLSPAEFFDLTHTVGSAENLIDVGTEFDIPANALIEVRTTNLLALPTTAHAQLHLTYP